jgi:hypothetical protein
MFEASINKQRYSRYLNIKKVIAILFVKTTILFTSILSLTFGARISKSRRMQYLYSLTAYRELSKNDSSIEIV